jgi:hypothetical protein
MQTDIAMNVRFVVVLGIFHFHFDAKNIEIDEKENELFCFPRSTGKS